MRDVPQSLAGSQLPSIIGRTVEGRQNPWLLLQKQLHLPEPTEPSPGRAPFREKSPSKTFYEGSGLVGRIYVGVYL